MNRRFRVETAPHLPAARSVRSIMLQVLAALAPAVLVLGFGYGLVVPLQLLWASLCALLLEAAMLKLRGVRAAPFLGDGSAVLTAVLFALCLPPGAPWWIAPVGMVAAIVVAKQLYGGLGYNLFNPAMVGYAVVLLCFPRELSHWPVLPANDADLLAAFLARREEFDAIAGATPLDSLRTLQAQGYRLDEILAGDAFGGSAATLRIALALAYLAGGVFLLWRRLIPWQVPAAVLGGILLFSTPAWLWDADAHASPLFHLLGGASLLGAFFIATDPVTGCASPRGRLYFGAGVAAITLAIRAWGNYPDGFAFAILVMNAVAPWLDLHTRPRFHGEAQ